MASTKTPHKHGTLAGYNRHHREGTPYCDACKEAKRQVNAAMYQDPRTKKRGMLYTKARTQALTELSRIYPDHYRILYEEKVAKVFEEEWDG